MDIIIGNIRISSSDISDDGQKVLLYSPIRYGLNPNVLEFISFAQLRLDSTVPYVLFTPKITDDYTSYEWSITRKIGNLAFPNYIFFKNVVTNAGRYSYILCPDNTKMLNPAITLANSTSLNINNFQGFSFNPLTTDKTSVILSCINSEMMSVTQQSGSKIMARALSPNIFGVRKGIIPDVWSSTGFSRVTSFAVCPSYVYNVKNCDVLIKSIDIIARTSQGMEGTLNTYCQNNEFQTCLFYSNKDMCSSGKTFKNCPKGIVCGTDNCFGSCFKENFDCIFEDVDFKCNQNIPPQPNPPNPDNDYTYIFIAVGITLFLIIILVIYSLSKKSKT